MNIMVCFNIWVSQHVLSISAYSLFNCYGNAGKVYYYNIAGLSIDETMIGKQYSIAGMIMEVIADEGDKWKVRNHTTKESILMDKAFLEKSIKLGKAEEVTAENK